MSVNTQTAARWAGSLTAAVLLLTHELQAQPAILLPATLDVASLALDRIVENDLPRVAIRATSDLPDAAIELIALRSVPSRLVIPPNTKPEDVLSRFCGGALTNSYVSVFDKVNPAFIRRPEPRERMVDAPACPRWERNARVKATEGDTVASLIEKKTGVDTDKSLSSCTTKETGQRCTKTALQLAMELNPQIGNPNRPLPAGTNVTLPLVTAWTSILLRPETGSSSEETAEKFISDLVTESLVQNVSRPDAVPASPALVGSQFEFLSLLAPPDDKDTENPACRQAGSGRANWPFDTARVAAILTSTLKRIKDIEGWTPTPTIVRIADSGFHVNKPDLLPPSFFAVNRRDNPNGVDDDNNKYIDDYYGFGPDHKGEVRPFSGDKYADHGTQVAQMLLGGSLRSTYPDLKNFVNLHFAKITRQTIYEKDGQRTASYDIDADLLKTAATYSFVPASIIHMSIGSSRHLGDLEDNITSKNLMLIVAAGNSKSDLAESEIYPAANGGPNKERIITVAASDGYAGRADFTNHSAFYVDLLAPGCNLPPAKIHTTDPVLFGTSFAAPLVSLTTAILRSLGVDQPRLIKARLYGGVDYNPALADIAAASGVLNIPKTIMAFDDVIETTTLSEPTAGRWIRPEQGVKLCQELPAILPQRIAKVTRVARTNAPAQLRVLYRDAHNTLHARICNPVGNSLDFHVDGDEKPTTVTWDQFRDLVPRVRTLRKN